eukprot:354313-Chlamydomonas_euryale.AAC.5
MPPSTAAPQQHPPHNPQTSIAHATLNCRLHPAQSKPSTISARVPCRSLWAALQGAMRLMLPQPNPHQPNPLFYASSPGRPPHLRLGTLYLTVPQPQPRTFPLVPSGPYPHLSPRPIRPLPTPFPSSHPAPTHTFSSGIRCT